MRTVRQLSVALVVTLALAAPASAGEIETGYVPPPPPGEIHTTAPGQIDTPGEIQTGAPGEIHLPPGEAGAVDPATQAALSLLRAALSLL
jgi:hypothetical protein